MPDVLHPRRTWSQGAGHVSIPGRHIGLPYVCGPCAQVCRPHTSYISLLRLKQCPYRFIETPMISQQLAHESLFGSRTYHEIVHGMTAARRRFGDLLKTLQRRNVSRSTRAGTRWKSTHLAKIARGMLQRLQDRVKI